MRKPAVGVMVVAVLWATMAAISVRAAQAAVPPVGFSAKTNVAVGSAPLSVATADLNGDGHLDLAVTNSGSNTVSVLLGDGAGGFGPRTDFVVGRNPDSVAIGDLNGDGHLDLAVTNNTGSETMSVLLGDGTGSFGPKTDLATAGMPFWVATGDLNSDGHLDLAVANAGGSAAVSVYLGDGTGSFGPHAEYATDTEPTMVAIGDLNNDTHLDLVVANAAGSVTVLLGDGTGSFGPEIASPIGLSPNLVAMGDLNGDGYLDLAAAGWNDFVSVLPGDGTGHFGPETELAVGSSEIYGLAMADLNGDGQLDLAVANRLVATVSVLLGDGAGGLGSRTDFATGPGPVGMAIGDLNGDGRPDLAIASEVSDTVSVLLNTAPSLPSAPTILDDATGGNMRATVSWLAPTRDGGAPVTGYVVTPYVEGVAQESVTFQSTATSETVTGLSNGVTYTFTVAAINAVGTGPESTPSNPVTPAPTAPDAPTIGTVLGGDGQATVSWTAPASDGGSPITGYVVTPYIGYSPRPATTFDSTATTETIAGLTNGTTYRFAVQAVNAMGTGPHSAVSKPVNPGGAAAPTIGTAVAGDGQATVSWTAPVDEGGSPITGYVVTPYIGYAPQPTTTFNSTAVIQTVTRLTNGISYRFRVQAVNASGAGAYSTVSNPVTPMPAPSPPGAPTAVRAAVVYPNVAVSWTAPGSNGGSPITGYVVTPYVDGVAQSPITFMSTATTETITGLGDGVTYTFTVAAINAVGTGPGSTASSPVTVAPTAPGPPIIGIAIAGDGRAIVSWTAPASDGGSPITGYIVTPYVSTWTGKPRTFNSTDTTQTITGVTNGWPYRFRVQAVNAFGTGSYSAETNVVVPAAG